jgi:hypothetical protein
MANAKKLAISEGDRRGVEYIPFAQKHIPANANICRKTMKQSGRNARSVFVYIACAQDFEVIRVI